MTTQSSDVFPITNIALKQIIDETNCDLNNWDGPDIVIDQSSSDYKVEWRPNTDSLDEVLTIYSDGEWNLFFDGEFFEGSMMSFHDVNWIKTCTNKGVLIDLAKSSWLFFKNIHDEKES